VTWIGAFAFEKSEYLERIEIPYSVSYINCYAFSGCTNLKVINIPNGVETIEMGAFWNCSSLEEITLPGSLKRIGTQAFLDTSITELVIPKSVSDIEEKVFYNNPDKKIVVSLEDGNGRYSLINDCLIEDGIRLINFNSTGDICIIPNTVRIIDEDVFLFNKTIKKIVLPSNLETITSRAFESCESLKSVTIPKSVKKIGVGAFYLSGVEKVYYEGTEEEWTNLAVEPWAIYREVGFDLFSFIPGETIFFNYTAPLEAICATAEQGKNVIFWNEVAGATKYLLQKRVYENGAWKSWGTISSTLTGTTYEDTKITPNTKYQYRVYAYNGEWSDFVRTEVTSYKPEKPQAPANITATSEAGKVTVSWDTVHGATKYLLQRRYYDGSKWTGWGTISSTLTTNSYTDAKVTAGLTYQYRVYAYNGEWSDFTRTEIVISNVPLPPETVTATAVAGKITVNWSVVTGATKYLLQRRYNDGSGWKGWGTISSTMTGTSYEDTKAVAGYTYQYRVYSYNGEWSTFTRVEVVAVSTPQAPETVTATATAGKITVNWSAVNGATKYLLQRRYNDGNGWKGWSTISSTMTGTSYEDTKAVAGYTYQYRVYTYNGEWSATYTRAEVVAVSTPQAPETVTATATAGKITVNWSAVNGATKYLFQRRYNDGNGWKGWSTISSTMTGTVYEDTKAVAGYTYQYRVYAYNGEWSNTYTRVEVVAVSAPQAPATLNAEAEAGKNVISWSAVPGATQYLLQKRYYNGTKWTGWSTVSSTLTGTEYEDSRVSSGVLYQYRAYAYNGEWSDYVRTEVTAQ
jgi:hypothetical protein